MNESRRHPRVPRSFTLAELLVVMGLIAILATITVVAVGAIANDARLASGKNTVLAALTQGRLLALKNNRIVLVAFRAKPIGELGNDQVIEAVTAEWTGETYFGTGSRVIDRFAPIPDVARRELPGGVKVGAPLYFGSNERWATSSDLPAIDANGEVAGAVIGVMFGPDGTVVTQNTASDSNRIFIDYNNDPFQRQNGIDRAYDQIVNDLYCDLGNDDDGNPITEYFCQALDDDEPYILIAPFLAVFDDEEARELLDPSRWVLGGGEDRTSDLTEYIDERADRMHFNRYTGVVMK